MEVVVEEWVAGVWVVVEWVKATIITTTRVVKWEAVVVTVVVVVVTVVMVVVTVVMVVVTVAKIKAAWLAEVMTVAMGATWAAVDMVAIPT